MTDNSSSDRRFMRAAIDEASAALTLDEVPVGAVIVHDGRIIGRGHNLREKLQDPTAHAEMIAITAAAEALGSWRLEGCSMFVTLEPCPMCAGAIVQARIQRLLYGASDPKAGACRSLYEITTDPRLNHRVELAAPVLERECAALLGEFFALKRAKGKK